MIGQKTALSKVKDFIQTSSFPTLILYGDKGSGKKTLVEEALQDTTSYTVPDVKKETIVNLIQDVYKVITKVIYVIPDVDTMSVAAMNSLLKITEEPPNNAKFILTCNRLDNVLPTILSRATLVHMDLYSSNELLEYASMYKIDKKWNKLLLNVCNNPGDVDILLNCGVDEYANYVNLVFTNIDTVSYGNALKICNKIALKEDSEGIDLKLFFRGFMVLALQNYSDVMYEWIKITSKYLSRLTIKGINKTMLFDNWVIEIKGGV